MHLKIKLKLNILILNVYQKNYIYITKSKNNSIFTGHIFCCYFSIQKVSHWKSYATFISTTNPTGYYASLWNFFGDPPDCKHRTFSSVRNDIIFFPLYPRMKPTDLHKSRDFQTLYAIFGFSRTSVHTLAIKFRDKDASTFMFFCRYGNNFDSGTWISFFLSMV